GVAGGGARAPAAVVRLGGRGGGGGGGRRCGGDGRRSAARLDDGRLRMTREECRDEESTRGPAEASGVHGRESVSAPRETRQGARARRSEPVRSPTLPGTRRLALERLPSKASLAPSLPASLPR